MFGDGWIDLGLSCRLRRPRDAVAAGEEREAVVVRARPDADLG